MKTLKLVMIAAIVSFAMVSYATADKKHDHPVNKQIINLSFDMAIQNPGLVAAMHLQLNDNFLSVNQQTYTVDVLYMGYIVRITGTYAQWSSFFSNKIKLVDDLNNNT